MNPLTLDCSGHAVRGQARTGNTARVELFPFSNRFLGGHLLCLLSGFRHLRSARDAYQAAKQLHHKTLSSRAASLPGQHSLLRNLNSCKPDRPGYLFNRFPQSVIR